MHLLQVAAEHGTSRACAIYVTCPQYQVSGVFELHNKTAEVRVAAWLRRPVVPVRALLRLRVSCACPSIMCTPIVTYFTLYAAGPWCPGGGLQDQVPAGVVQLPWTSWCHGWSLLDQLHGPMVSFLLCVHGEVVRASVGCGAFFESGAE